MLTLWSALKVIPAIILDGFKSYQERKIAEHKVIMAQADARRELALAAMKAELELGQVQLKATGRLFKYFTFFMWFGPFIISTMFPEYGVKVFENLNQLPQWYVQSCMVLMFAVWGISVSRDSILTIFSGLGDFFKQRSKLKFHRKMFYDVVRSTEGNLTQHEVELYDKAIDKALSEERI